MTTRADVALTKVAFLDSTMAYREAGSPNSPTLLFLHGNPTWSYIWRNIIPLVAPVAHCIAPDLIGFVNRGNPISNIGFSTTFATSTRFSIRRVPRPRTLWRMTGDRRWRFIWPRAGRSSSGVWPSWSSSVLCRPRMTFTLTQSRPSRSSERQGWARG